MDARYVNRRRPSQTCFSNKNTKEEMDERRETDREPFMSKGAEAGTYQQEGVTAQKVVISD